MQSLRVLALQAALYAALGVASLAGSGWGCLLGQSACRDHSRADHRLHAALRRGPSRDRRQAASSVFARITRGLRIMPPTDPPLNLGLHADHHLKPTLPIVQLPPMTTARCRRRSAIRGCCFSRCCRRFGIAVMNPDRALPRPISLDGCAD